MISKGDYVSVSFHASQLTLVKHGLVLYTPVASGDHWVIKDVNAGDIHYISEPCTITKKE